MVDRSRPTPSQRRAPGALSLFSFPEFDSSPSERPSSAKGFTRPPSSSRFPFNGSKSWSAAPSRPQAAGFSTLALSPGGWSPPAADVLWVKRVSHSGMAIPLRRQRDVAAGVGSIGLRPVDRRKDNDISNRYRASKASLSSIRCRASLSSLQPPPTRASGAGTSRTQRGVSTGVPSNPQSTVPGHPARLMSAVASGHAGRTLDRVVPISASTAAANVSTPENA